MDAVKGFMFPGSGGPGAQDDGVPWWMKYASKSAGILGGVGNSLYSIGEVYCILCNKKPYYRIMYEFENMLRNGDN